MTKWQVRLILTCPTDKMAEIEKKVMISLHILKKNSNFAADLSKVLIKLQVCYWISMWKTFAQ